MIGRMEGVEGPLTGSVDISRWHRERAGAAIRTSEARRTCPATNLPSNAIPRSNANQLPAMQSDTARGKAADNHEFDPAGNIPGALSKKAWRSLVPFDYTQTLRGGKDSPWMRRRRLMSSLRAAASDTPAIQKTGGLDDANQESRARSGKLRCVLRPRSRPGGRRNP